MAVEVTEFSSTDPDVANAAIERVYSPDQPMVFSGPTQEFSGHVRLVTAGSVGADQVRHTMSATCEMPPPEIFFAMVGLGGATRLSANGEVVDVLPGAVAAFPTGRTLHGRWSDITVVTLRIPLATLHRVADERLGGTAGRLRFHAMQPVSEAMAAQWRHLTRFVHQQLATPASTLEHPLIEAQVADLIAATALTAFPHSAIDHHQPGTGYVGPATIRRAIEYIEANAERPITVTDVARVAGVSPRALQQGFRRHHDTTPNQYLRRVRLESAHRQLRAADPTEGATVADIASAWGFGPGARFASFYRERFGVHPSHTLRTGRRP